VKAETMLVQVLVQMQTVLV